MYTVLACALLALDVRAFDVSYFADFLLRLVRVLFGLNLLISEKAGSPSVSVQVCFSPLSPCKNGHPETTRNPKKPDLK